MNLNRGNLTVRIIRGVTVHVSRSLLCVSQCDAYMYMCESDVYEQRYRRLEVGQGAHIFSSITEPLHRGKV